MLVFIYLKRAVTFVTKSLTVVTTGGSSINLPIFLYICFPIMGRFNTLHVRWFTDSIKFFMMSLKFVFLKLVARLLNVLTDAFMVMLSMFTILL